MTEHPLLLAAFMAAEFIALALFLASHSLSKSAPDSEKLSAFECGFSCFNDARLPFDIQFLLVGILFIIFDLEVALLFP